MRIARGLSRLCLAVLLSMGTNAAAGGLCPDGVELKDPTGVRRGCQFRNWENAGMCASAHLLPVSNAGFCAVCLEEPYRTQVMDAPQGQGNWSAVTPGDFGCLSCIDKPSGNVGWWSFDEHQGYGEFYDLSTGRVNQVDRYATDSGSGSLLLAGKVARAWRTNGGYVAVPHAAALNFANAPFTFEGWIQLYPNQSYNGPRVLVSKVKTTAGVTRGFEIRLVDRKLQAQVWNGTSAVYTASSATVIEQNPGAWHHIAVSFNWQGSLSTMHVAFDVDGQVGTPTTWQFPGVPDLTNTSDVYFGRSTAGIPQAFDFGMDEFSLYNRYLSPTTRKKLHAAGRSGTCKELPRDDWWWPSEW